ncbi:CAP domain-containing protein [Phyllosticta capitalensis]|uniref:CAP domain-containing protein n=1 Tax=Phyllosticta capitalensis TaxID=121624 RepID=A0ABR1Z3K8_9PEZI
MAKAFMAYHNVHRTYHGACSLLWDPALAKQAQAAANTCKFQHQMTGDNGQNVAEQSASGNIAAGTVSMWYEEGSKTNYQGGNMQQGHYTQVLWKGTYALGCGVKNCGQMTLVFCDYAPAGNMMGAFKQNVGSRVAGARPVCAEQQAMSQYANSGGGQGGGGGAQGKCITDQELGLPAGAGGGGGGGGQGGGTGGGTGMKKGKGGMRGGGGGGGSPFAQLMQGSGGGGDMSSGGG